MRLKRFWRKHRDDVAFYAGLAVINLVGAALGWAPFWVVTVAVAWALLPRHWRWPR